MQAQIGRVERLIRDMRRDSQTSQPVLCSATINYQIHGCLCIAQPIETGLAYQDRYVGLLAKVGSLRNQ